jgi:3-oxoacyl-[acyl-carrier protein] reductase
MVTSDAGRRVAIVTGAAGGLGAAIGMRLAASGSIVILTDKDGARVREQASAIAARSQHPVVGWESDVASAEANEALIARVDETYGRLDQLVNNAGIKQHARFGAISVGEWETVMAVNLWGPASLCQAALPLWRKTGGGRIVNIASRSWLSGGPAAYVASKAGVVGLTRALAVELGPLNVTVNAVAPGLLQTPLVEANRTPQELEAWLEQYRKLTLLGQLATVEDVANAVEFLASDRASAITGEVLHVCAGSQLAPTRS